MPHHRSSLHPAATIGWVEARLPAAVWRHCLLLARRRDLPYGSLRNMGTVMMLDALLEQPWRHCVAWRFLAQALSEEAMAAEAGASPRPMVHADLRLLGLQDATGTIVETGAQMAASLRAEAEALQMPETLFMAATVLWWTSQRAERRIAPEAARVAAGASLGAERAG